MTRGCHLYITATGYQAVLLLIQIIIFLSLSIKINSQDIFFFKYIIYNFLINVYILL